MTAYIIKSSVSLLLMFGLYWFLLRKEKLFVFNRFFLIFSIVSSFIIPSIVIPFKIQNDHWNNNLVTILNNNISALNHNQNTAPNTSNQSYTAIAPSNSNSASATNLY